MLDPRFRRPDPQILTFRTWGPEPPGSWKLFQQTLPYEQNLNLETNLIIEALGFEPEDLPSMFNKKELIVTQWGTIKINYKNMMTSIEGVFAAGDIVRGASLVVWGIKDGRDVAEHIHDFIKEKEIKKFSNNKLGKEKKIYA